MKKSFIQLYLYMILIGWSASTAIETSKECIVRNKIDEDLDASPFFSYKFRALFSGAYSNFTMLLKCHNKHDFDTIKVSPKKLSYSRNRRSTGLQNVNIPEITQGWHGFQMLFATNVTLLDENDNLILNEEPDPDCGYKSLTLQEGNFTESCYSRTSAWIIDSTNALEVPLPKEQTYWCQELTMFAKTHFSPRLQTSKALRNRKQFKDHDIGYPDGRFEPLVEHKLTFEVKKDHRILEVKHGNTVIEKITINQEASTLKLSSRDENSFAVLQRKCLETEQNEGILDAKAFPFLIGMVVTSTAFIVLMSWNVYKHCSTNKSEKNTKKPPLEAKSSSGYLVPSQTQADPNTVRPSEVPQVPAPVRPGRPRDSLHIYEEIDEEAIAKIIQRQANNANGKEVINDYYNVEKGMKHVEFDSSEYIDFPNNKQVMRCMDTSETDTSSSSSGSICSDE